MNEIQGFAKSEYLMTLQSIIMGLIASEYFDGVGKYVRRSGQFSQPILYLSFTLLTFIILLIFWWNSWNRSDLIVVTILDYLEIFPYTLIFYLITVVLFRDIHSRSSNLLFSYFRNSRKLFGLLALYFAYDLMVSVSGLITFQLAGLILSCLGAVFRNKILHIAIMVVGLLSIVIYVGIDFFWGIVGRGEQILSGYSKTEHLTIFLSFLYGYTVARFFMGWGRIVRNWKTIDFSWIHFLWSAFAFILLIDIWWGQWETQQYLTNHLLNFLLIMTTPFYLYLIAIFLFPPGDEHVTHYQEFFIRQRKFIFPVFGILLLSNLGLSAYFGQFQLEITENMLRSGGAVLSVAAWNFRSVTIHFVLFFAAISMVLLDLLVKASIL